MIVVGQRLYYYYYWWLTEWKCRRNISVSHKLRTRTTGPFISITNTFSTASSFFCFLVIAFRSKVLSSNFVSVPARHFQCIRLEHLVSVTVSRPKEHKNTFYGLTQIESKTSERAHTFLFWILNGVHRNLVHAVSIYMKIKSSIIFRIYIMRRDCRRNTC